MHYGRLTGGFVAALMLFAGRAFAQTPSPSPRPERLEQDQLDLQARANVVQGSGARALGMAGAFLARADDATAASWNPAGLSYLRLPEISAVWAASSFTSTDTQPPSETQPDEFIKTDHRRDEAPDFFGATYPIGIKGHPGSVQLSFQRVISLGARRTITDVQGPIEVRSRGGFDVLAFGTGLQVGQRLRVGATVNRWLNGYTQHSERTITTGTPGGDRIGTVVIQDADFRVNGWNFNFGVIWSPTDVVNVGAVVKTPFTANVRLSRERMDLRPEPFLPLANDFSRDDLRLDFPGALGVGASTRPRSNLTVSIDYTRTFWSKGRILNFFTLPRAGIPTESSEDFFPTLPYPSLNDLDQRDTEQVRIGAEYVLIRGSIKWPMRLGYFNDRQYFRDVSSRTPQFDAVTVGTGLIVGRVLFDVAYLHEGGRYKDLDFHPIRVRSHRVFASIIYRHGR